MLKIILILLLKILVFIFEENETKETAFIIKIKIIEIFNKVIDWKLEDIVLFTFQFLFFYITDILNTFKI